MKKGGAERLGDAMDVTIKTLEEVKDFIRILKEKESEWAGFNPTLRDRYIHDGRMQAFEKVLQALEGVRIEGV